ALDVAGFTKALAECGQIACTIDRRRTAEESYYRHRRLLRARRERPRGCSAAENRDEVATSHSISSSASNWIELGTSRPSARAVTRLMTNSNLVDCMTGRSAGLAPLRIRPV